jgi:hypothetical protein
MLLALAAAVGLFSCDTNPAGLTLCIEGSAQNQNVIHYSCPGEMVLSVEVLDAHGDNPGGATDSVLWLISTKDGHVLPESTPVGHAPNGFDTDVPLSGPLPGDSALSLVIVTRAKPDSDSFSITMGFKPDDLKDREVMTDQGAFLSPDSFDSRAKQACA